VAIDAQGGLRVTLFQDLIMDAVERLGIVCKVTSLAEFVVSQTVLAFCVDSNESVGWRSIAFMAISAS